VQLYRAARAADDAAEAEKQAGLAVDFFSKSRQNAGKKRFLARQLPFDIYVVRKINKWEARAKEWGVSLVDAVGVSPVEEMIFFWNGLKKMTEAQLNDSLDALAWSEDPNRNPHWSRETPDERAILGILRAAIHRNMGKNDQAKALLRKEVLAYDKSQLKGHLRDNWMCPTAHYEMGANLWAERDKSNEGCENNRRLVREATEWLEKAGKWESYELDARIGLKVTTGLDTMKKWKSVHDA
jgi:hypothetical protein